MSAITAEQFEAMQQDLPDWCPKEYRPYVRELFRVYTIHLTHPAQAVDVDEAMVERMAKWMCRHEIPSLASLDEVLWRMGNWRRYVDEARSALTAALPSANGKEG